MYVSGIFSNTLNNRVQSFSNICSVSCVLIYSYVQVFFCLLLTGTSGNFCFKHFQLTVKLNTYKFQALNQTIEHTFHHIALFGLHLPVTKPFPFVYRLITAWWGFSTNTFIHWSLCKDTVIHAVSMPLEGKIKLRQDMQAVSRSDIKRAGASSEHQAVPTQISFCTTCARATAKHEPLL